jgi:hypothetical protein
VHGPVPKCIHQHSGAGGISGRKKAGQGRSLHLKGMETCAPWRAREKSAGHPAGSRPAALGSRVRSGVRRALRAAHLRYAGAHQPAADDRHVLDDDFLRRGRGSGRGGHGAHELPGDESHIAATTDRARRRRHERTPPTKRTSAGGDTTASPPARSHVPVTSPGGRGLRPARPSP